MFLSGQATCALLLGAGLLLRAQAALNVEPRVATPAAIEAPRAREPAPAEARQETPAVKHGNRVSQKRKGFAHPARGRHGHRRGVAIAGRGMRWG